MVTQRVRGTLSPWQTILYEMGAGMNNEHVRAISRLLTVALVAAGVALIWFGVRLGRVERRWKG